MTPLIPEEKHRIALTTGTDVPAEIPAVSLAIGQVGISAKTVWISLPEGRVPFTARVMVNLAANRRGIHMSRIEQAISRLHGEKFPDPVRYAVNLARMVLSCQEASTCSIHLTGQLPHLTTTPVSQHLSIDSIDIQVQIDLGKHHAGTGSQAIGVALHHLTACPCTQAYNAVVFDRDQAEDPPLATHSQRSRTELFVGTTLETALPAISQLVHCLESSLHISQDLLKRPDEAELVYKAHRQPHFAEDAVRETARAAGRHLAGSLPPEALIRVSTCSLESIHIHNVECMLEIQLAEILNG